MPRRLITSLQQQFVSLRRGTPGSLPPPVDNMDDHWSPIERAGVEQALAYSVVGAPDTVEPALEALIAETRADELMLPAQIYDHTARLRSFEIAAEVRHEHRRPSAGIFGSIGRFHRVNIPHQATQPVQLIQQMQDDRDAFVIDAEIHL